MQRHSISPGYEQCLFADGVLRRLAILWSMAKEWIENLATEIKQKNREAAEEFGRSQHQADIIEGQGRVFFGDMVRSLEDNFTQIRRQLQGDPTSAEIAVMTTGATQVRLTRSRFPWFDAHITHEDGKIALEYAKDLGITGDPALADKKTLVFEFKVSPEDKLWAEDAFGDTPQKYETPDDLARKITEILFGV